MDRNGILRARIEPHHALRLEELSKTTGLNASQIIRCLIENAVVARSPALAATLNLARVSRDAETTECSSGIPA